MAHNIDEILRALTTAIKAKARIEVRAEIIAELEGARPQAKAKPGPLRRVPVSKSAPKPLLLPHKAPKNLGSRVALGRQAVLKGLRPKLVEAVVTVMKNDVLSSPEIFQRLRKRKWAPDAVNPVAYISYTLSDNVKIFERVDRGRYRVRGVVSAPPPTSVADPISEVLFDTKRFANNAALLQVVPASIQSQLKVKDSRKRLVGRILKLLPAPEKQHFLDSLVEKNPFDV